jgi:hypothetical protein
MSHAAGAEGAPSLAAAADTRCASRCTMGASPEVQTLMGTLAESGGGVARFTGSLFILFLIWWPFVLAPFFGTWQVLEKAGRPGWTSLVPFYNWIQLLRVARLPGWWLLVLCVPLVNVAAWIIACTKLARCFGVSTRFAWGLILLPPVFMVLLGMSDARYQVLEEVGKTTSPPLRVGAARL